MNAGVKTILDLKEEVAALKHQLAEAQAQRCQLPEDVLTLSVLERAPFTVWACRRNFEIVLWNASCEKRYMCPRALAIGRDFFELFVHEHERDQARTDCANVIDGDISFINFIADDHDLKGRPIRMLTNCFRVWDGRYREYVQAEIGVDISDLRLSEERHRTIQELGRRMEELKRQSTIQQILVDRQSLQLKLRDAYQEKTRLWHVKHEELCSLSRRMHEHVTDEGRASLAAKNATLVSIRAAIDLRYNSIDGDIASSNSLDELARVRAEVSGFMADRLPDELYR